MSYSLEAIYRTTTWAVLKHSTALSLLQEKAATGQDINRVSHDPSRSNQVLSYQSEGKRNEVYVKTVQEVTDLPLSIDTTNIEAMEAGLRVHRGKALINSISARPERIEALMPLAKRFNAGFIGLTLGAEGIPRDANERGLLAAQIMAEAAGYGIPEEDIWLDPIVLPVNSQQIQIQGCTEFVMMLPELAPNSKSTCGISNVSNGVPGHLRGILNRTYLIILKRYGMFSAIADAFDGELREIARGKRPGLESLIYRVMDGQEIDTSSLSIDEIHYIKTTKVLLGHTLYSDSWLEI